MWYSNENTDQVRPLGKFDERSHPQGIRTQNRRRYMAQLFLFPPLLRQMRIYYDILGEYK